MAFSGGTTIVGGSLTVIDSRPRQQIKAARLTVIPNSTTPPPVETPPPDTNDDGPDTEGGEESDEGELADTAFPLEEAWVI